MQVITDAQSAKEFLNKQLDKRFSSKDSTANSAHEVTEESKQDQQSTVNSKSSKAKPQAANPLEGKSIAFLATDGVEQSELVVPAQRLLEAGATITLVSPKNSAVQGFKHHDKGQKFKVDLALDEANAKDFDALVLAGGVFNPDSLRNDEAALDFVRAFNEQEKCIAAICHAPQVLIEAGIVDGSKITSFPSIKTDLENAGADWQDGEVIVDWNLITSRTPKDLEAFSTAIISQLKTQEHA